jgi:hypothetical protein
MRGEDTAFALVTPHFSSARELTGTKLAKTCIKKVLGIYLYVPCRLHICAHGGRIYILTGMYRKEVYEEENDYNSFLVSICSL